MTLERRVADLETQNRRSRIIAVLALIGIAVLLALTHGAFEPPLAAQERADYTLTAQKLVLKNKDGNTVFVIDANSPGCHGAFILKDETGRHRISFGIAKDTGLTFCNVWDRNGTWVKALAENQP